MNDWKCKCGNPVMYADTEDWNEPCCYDCYAGRLEEKKMSDFEKELENRILDHEMNNIEFNSDFSCGYRSGARWAYKYLSDRYLNRIENAFNAGADWAREYTIKEYEEKLKIAEELQVENDRLTLEFIKMSTEHPCYKLSKELEAENNELREKLKVATKALEKAKFRIICINAGYHMPGKKCSYCEAANLVREALEKIK